MQEMPKSTGSVIKINLRKAAVFAAIAIAVVLVDQISKWIVVKSMTEGESIPIIKDFFHFTYILNKGAAFGMLADNRWIFLVLSTVSILGITVGMVLFSGKIRWGYGICFSMIVGGGIGNMIDRLFNGDMMGKGAVIDFIDFCGIWRYIFNIADSFVCVGAGIFFLLMIIDEITEFKKSRQVKSQAHQDAPKEENGTEHSDNGDL